MMAVEALLVLWFLMQFILQNVFLNYNNHSQNFFPFLESSWRELYDNNTNGTGSLDIDINFQEYAPLTIQVFGKNVIDSKYNIN